MVKLNLPPRDVLITPGRAGPANTASAPADLPGEWIQPRSGCARRGMVMYRHGGACCVGAPATHRPITGALLLLLAPWGDLTLIPVSTDDLLHAEALRLHAALRAAGVPVRREVTARRWPVFQLQAGVLPCANDALARAAGFIGATVGQPAAPAATLAATQRPTPAPPARLKTTRS